MASPAISLASPGFRLTSSSTYWNLLLGLSWWLDDPLIPTTWCCKLHKIWEEISSGYTNVTLQGTNISPLKAARKAGKMIFLVHRWDMLVPSGVGYAYIKTSMWYFVFLCFEFCRYCFEMNPVFVPEQSVTFLLQHEQQERMTILLHV